MRITHLLLALSALALLAFVALAPSVHHAADAAPAPERTEEVVFVCLNGVAMSVWSARTFDRLAGERGLPFRAVSRASAATYGAVPLRMKLALALDGYRVGDYRPQVVSAEDVRGAARVIVIDTQLPEDASAEGTPVERWDGFPPMREQYFVSRAALKTRVEALVERLAVSAAP